MAVVNGDSASEFALALLIGQNGGDDVSQNRGNGRGSVVGETPTAGLSRTSGEISRTGQSYRIDVVFKKKGVFSHDFLEMFGFTSAYC